MVIKIIPVVVNCFIFRKRICFCCTMLTGCSSQTTIICNRCPTPGLSFYCYRPINITLHTIVDLYCEPTENETIGNARHSRSHQFRALQVGFSCKRGGARTIQLGPTKLVSIRTPFRPTIRQFSALPRTTTQHRSLSVCVLYISSHFIPRLVSRAARFSP